MNIEVELTLPVIFVNIPIFKTLIVYFIIYKITRHRWKAIHISVQWTAIFYIIAVTILLQKIFAYDFISIILISLILMLAIILIIQRNLHTEVLLGKGLKVLARFSFLLFGCIYILLIIYEIIDYIYTHYLN